MLTEEGQLVREDVDELPGRKSKLWRGGPFPHPSLPPIRPSRLVGMSLIIVYGLLRRVMSTFSEDGLLHLLLLSLSTEINISWKLFVVEEYPNAGLTKCLVNHHLIQTTVFMRVRSQQPLKTALGAASGLHSRTSVTVGIEGTGAPPTFVK